MGAHRFSPNFQDMCTTGGSRAEKVLRGNLITVVAMDLKDFLDLKDFGCSTA